MIFYKYWNVKIYYFTNAFKGVEKVGKIRHNILIFLDSQNA